MQEFSLTQDVRLGTANGWHGFCLEKLIQQQLCNTVSAHKLYTNNWTIMIAVTKPNLGEKSHYHNITMGQQVLSMKFL